MDIADRYATAKANLRDTVKWLAAAYAGLAALVLAGAPFSNLGSLPLSSPRLWVGGLSLLAAMVILYLGWKKILFLLQSQSVDAGHLRSTFNSDEVPAGPQRDELTALNEEFKKKSDRLLPPELKPKTYEALEAHINTCWKEAGKSTSEAERAPWMDAWKTYSAHAQQLLNWASYWRLDRRVSAALPDLHKLNAAVLMLLVVFAWSANPSKSDRAEASTIVIEHVLYTEQQTTPIAPASLRPVLFELGKADVTEDGVRAVGAARDHLIQHPSSALLLLAHTDTLGLPRMNRDLARRRGTVVRKMLVDEGGISAARVFVAELPESALPVVTLQQTGKKDNRTVRFLVVTQPPL